ncbi:MAG: anti-sigma factor [Terriglobia bacterium]
MNEHPQFEEIFDEYALGLLEGEEKRALELHAKGCPECTRRLEGARARVALMAFAAPPAAPSPAVKERLMRQIAADEPPRIEQPPTRKHSGFWGWGVSVFAVAVVALAIITGFLASRNRQMEARLHSLEAAQTRLIAKEEQQQAGMNRARSILDVLTSPGTLKVSLVPAQAHPTPQGKAFYNPQKGLVFYAANLPRLAPGRTYQLWLVPTQGNPLSAGIFATDPHGNGEILLPPLPPGVSAKAFAVTIEPAGGEPQPTGKKVLIGAVS